MAKPLLDLLKKELSFKWKDEQHRAFEDLKEKLSFTLVLKFPNFTKLFKVHINVHDFVIKGILIQEGHLKSFVEHNCNGQFTEGIVHCCMLFENLITLFGDT
jgi:hypothetical protein